MRSVYLEWIDHCSTNGWFKPEELGYVHHSALYPILNTTVGFIMKETKKELYITHTSTRNGYGADPICIMKSLVVRRKALKFRPVQ